MALQALALLPALFPSAPLVPIELITPPPTRTEHALTYSAGTVHAVTFHPALGGRHGGVVLLLGAGPLPLSDLALRFADALARAGVVVQIPQSSALLAERVVPEEREALRASFDLLTGQPDVDPARAGFVGLSASGGLSIVAAAQPELRDRVRFVNSFGSYFDATQLLVDVASHSFELDGRLVPWEPEPRTVEVMAIALLDALPDPREQAVLRRAFLEHEAVPEPEWAALSGEARTIRALLAGPAPRSAARAAVDRLPAAARARLQAISPSSSLADLRAHLYIMHDTADSFIPFAQSRELASAAGPRLVRRYTEFSLFEHVVPDRPIPWQAFLPELWALFWHVHAVLLELL